MVKNQKGRSKNMVTVKQKNDHYEFQPDNGSRMWSCDLSELSEELRVLRDAHVDYIIKR